MRSTGHTAAECKAAALERAGQAGVSCKPRLCKAAGRATWRQGLSDKRTSLLVCKSDDHRFVCITSHEAAGTAHNPIHDHSIIYCSRGV
jgi:hypothetical protein